MIPAVVKKIQLCRNKAELFVLVGKGRGETDPHKKIPPLGEGGISDAGWGIDPALPDTAGGRREIIQPFFNPLQRSVISLTEGSAGGAACGSVSYYEKQKLVCFRISVSLSGSIEPFLILWRCENG